MDINTLLLSGAFVGIIVGLAIPRQRLGCVVLLIVPMAMIVYVSRWQAAHPENIRSTSGLDFLFGPLWPSVGAVVGFFAMRLLRAWLEERKCNDR